MTNFRIIHNFSPGEEPRARETDRAAFEIFAQPVVSEGRPAQSAVDVTDAAPDSSAIAAVPTRGVELPPASGPTTFWAGRANQADRVKGTLATAARAPDAATLAAALNEAKAFFATLKPQPGIACGNPTAVQLRAVEEASVAFVRAADAALDLLTAQPNANLLAEALRNAAATASETVDSAQLARLLADLSRRLPSQE